MRRSSAPWFVARSVDPLGEASLDLEPAINGAVSANGLFPVQAMEEEFVDYLRWTKGQGLSRLVAFESMIDGKATPSSLRNRRMEEQFADYMHWVDDRGLSPFYAFMATGLD